MTSQKIPTVLIIGAGLGGLSLAQGLNRAGFNTLVLERDENHFSRVQGYRISVHSMGINALQQLIDPAHFTALKRAKIADVGDGFSYADAMQRPLLRIPNGGNVAVQFLRSEIRDLLLDGVNVLWNKYFTSFTEQGSKIIAQCKDGSSFEGDLLVGCDGSGSKVLDFMHKNIGAKISSLPKIIASKVAGMGGHIVRDKAWESLLPLNRAGPACFFGPHGDLLFVCFSEAKDRTPTIYWLLSEWMGERDESWYRMGALEEQQERLLFRCQAIVDNDGWHEGLRRLIRHTKPSEMRDAWILKTTHFSSHKKFPMWPSAKVTLVGDCAHAMPPDRGLGGNNVLEDARLLTSLLSSQKTITKEIIAEYERQMFTRAEKAVLESYRALRMHLLRNKLAASARNISLKLAWAIKRSRLA
jgi:2-polyprenyl-6-methoxyphenol hydroxylase-like FAD-dependent oxidoreductase